MRGGVGRGNSPDPQALWKALSPADKRRVQDYNSALRSPGTVIDPYAYADAADKTYIASPFEAIPLASSTAEFTAPVSKVIPFFGTSLEDQDAESMEFYAFEDEGFDYTNMAGQYGGVAVDPTAPARISIRPTSTNNPERPRTVAAGYSRRRKVLTVIFRDGTFYNYYEVSHSEWTGFRNAQSKGKYIGEHLDGTRGGVSKPRGPADIISIPASARSTVYRFLRTGQHVRKGIQPLRSKPKPARAALLRSRGQGGRFSGNINP